jgi:hypothetical protein
MGLNQSKRASCPSRNNLESGDRQMLPGGLAVGVKPATERGCVHSVGEGTMTSVQPAGGGSSARERG